MSVYTCTDARENLPELLNEVKKNIEVIISNNGETFKLIKVDIRQGAGLDVPGVSFDVSTDELVSFVRNARENRL
jgi:prevent-host-death family protein